MTYEDIYNEYLPKIDAAADSVFNEYKQKSVNKSDEEKYDLADSLADKITNVAIEGEDKMVQLSIQNNDESDDEQQWNDKLNDYSYEKVDELYDLAYDVNE